MPAPKLYDRVRETTATTGSSTYALSGVAVAGGYQTFASVLADGDTVPYGCIGLSGGVPAYEIAIGTFDNTPTPDTLARTTILQSSNADAAVEWDAGDKILFICTPAAYCEMLRMLHNFAGAVAPTSSEDGSDGYHAGSFWIDTVLAKLYVAVDSGGTWLQVLASRFAKIESSTSGTAAVLSGGGTAAIGVGAAATEDDAIAIGELAVADGVNSIVLGGYDNETTSGAENGAVLGGTLAYCDAKNSVALGGIATETVWYGENATGGLNSAGKTVVGSKVVMSRLTINATPSVLGFDNSTSNGYMNLREGEVVFIEGHVVARSTADFSCWKVTGAIYRNAAGNVTIDDAFTVTMVSQTAGAAAWALAVSADTTNQTPQFDITGAAATNITWGGHFMCTRVE